MIKPGMKRAVIITKPDGTEVEYESQSEATRRERLLQTKISAMCRGMLSIHRGHKARFKVVDP